MDDVIERLGGKALMERLRAERSADERYPQAMARLRRLLLSCNALLLEGQIKQFLELVALSKHDGTEVHQDRVSLAHVAFHERTRVLARVCRGRGGFGIARRQPAPARGEG
jgi:hypothetical protein